MSRVDIYSNGIVHCSVCALKTMPIEEVVAEVNRINPTGISGAWQKSEDTHFASKGKDALTNPCQCEDDETRQHWLMEC